ncbi:MAG: PTS sugar transporter subunit IIA [Lysobacterales bacterium]
MLISDLLTPERIALDVKARSKKRVLEMAASHLSSDTHVIDERAVYSGLCSRERIGSTALGRGVALPHCRLPNLDAASGSLLRLHDSVDFDSPDAQPVDLIFALMVPDSHEDQHLKLLALLAETFHDPERRMMIRGAESPEALIELLKSWELQQI